MANDERRQNGNGAISAISAIAAIGANGTGNGTPPHQHDDGLSKTKLMVNYIPESMSRDGMYSLFGSAGRIASCRLIANRGYGFVEYASAEDAERARDSFDGLVVQGKTLKVSFALLNPESKTSAKTDADCNLYISNLPSDMTLETLNSLFRSCGQITNSRISQGIAFVCFESRRQAEEAIARFNGACPAQGAPAMSVKFALKPGHRGAAAAAPVPQIPLYGAAPPYNNGELAALGARYGTGFPQTALLPPPGKTLSFLNKGHQRFNPMAAPNHAVPLMAPADVQRTTVYVLNIGEEIDELALWQLFGPYGAIGSIKVIKDAETKKNKGYAFVNMRDYEEASQAIRALNGYSVNGQVLSVSFKTQKTK